MITITDIEKDSHAERAGILPKDQLLAIDDHPIKDVLDYRFFLTEKKIKLTLKRGAKTFDTVIQKDRYDDIGLDFETYLMDRKRRCANRCIFCFIDQNPCGMRETVYFKDDDTRLSFLMGNYVTLTNVTDDELDRIIAMKMSPVNVSVHTTDPELRVKMLGNPKAAHIMEQLTRLKEGGISINCQIVSCRGINDGYALRRTVEELALLYPAVQSIAIVPAGLTRHRQNLPLIEPYDEASARAVLDLTEELALRFSERFGQRLVYAADEFYLAAKREFPPEEDYDGYPQLDNGVGLIRSTREELLDEIQWRWEEGNWKNLPSTPLNITLVTSVAANALLCEITAAITEKLPFVKFDVIAVKNRFFGETVTVAGLICGKDLVDAVRDRKPELLFFPAVALRHERDLFLDDYPLQKVSEELACPVYPIENGIPLLDTLETIITGGNSCQDP